MSPRIASGSRVFFAMSLATSGRRSPFPQIRTGGTRMPSLNMSFAVTSKEPGTLPPISAQWPLAWLKAISSPSAKIGRTTRVSLKWVPPI